MRTAKTTQRLVAVLAFERTQLLDVSGPVQTFASANELMTESGGAPPYRIAVVTRRGGPVCTSAGLAGMSPRTFARLYAAKMAVTPARMVEKIRVEAVRRILEETDMPIKQIAAECGFGQEERLRRAFARQVGTTPAEYRARF